MATVADDPKATWTMVTMADWYGQRERAVGVAAASAIWYHSAMPPVAPRWVLIRDPHGAFAT